MYKILGIKINNRGHIYIFIGKVFPGFTKNTL